MQETTIAVIANDLDDAAVDVDWVRKGLDSAGAAKIATNARYRSMISERLRSAVESIDHARRALFEEQAHDDAIAEGGAQ